MDRESVPRIRSNQSKLPRALIGWLQSNESMLCLPDISRMNDGTSFWLMSGLNTNMFRAITPNLYYKPFKSRNEEMWTFWDYINSPLPTTCAARVPSTFYPYTLRNGSHVLPYCIKNDCVRFAVWFYFTFHLFQCQYTIHSNHSKFTVIPVRKIAVTSLGVSWVCPRYIWSGIYDKRIILEKVLPPIYGIQ